MELLGGIIFGVIAVIPLMAWIWCIIDILKNEFTGYNKIIWLLVVILLPFVGMILYFFIGKNQKVQGSEKYVISKGLIIAVAIVAVGIGSFVGLVGESFFKHTKMDKTNYKPLNKEETTSNILLLEPFRVPLKGKTALNLTLQLEVSAHGNNMVNAKIPEIRELIISVVKRMSEEDLMSPEGKLKLKDDILIGVEQITGANAITNVYITDFSLYHNP